MDLYRTQNEKNYEHDEGTTTQLYTRTGQLFRVFTGPEGKLAYRDGIATALELLAAAR